ncbi:MAG: sigma-70 family RNA polymerase sigma factor [Planctomycetota bacterium]
MLLGVRGRTAAELPGSALPEAHESALATLLMDEFRRSRDGEVFETLVALVGPQLFARVRRKLRTLDAGFDPHEVLQDAIINIYRYPDRFAASRPGAFAAWSTTIVDNAIRRQLRQRKSGVPLSLSPTEVLTQHACETALSPAQEAQDHEECLQTAAAYGLVLQLYLQAFAHLSDRERFVLEQVEVHQRRYVEVAAQLGVRHEAVKMVVFRARKRVHDRIGAWLGTALGHTVIAAA